jgi:hypothetical protein
LRCWAAETAEAALARVARKISMASITFDSIVCQRAHGYERTSAHGIRTRACVRAYTLRACVSVFSLPPSLTHSLTLSPSPSHPVMCTLIRTLIRIHTHCIRQHTRTHAHAHAHTLGPSYFFMSLVLVFISLVLGPIKSLSRYVPS